MTTYQNRWALKRKEAGLCRRCAKPRQHYAWLCDECNAIYANQQRERRGHRKWEKGKPGRPPLAQEAP